MNKNIFEKLGEIAEYFRDEDNFMFEEVDIRMDWVLCRVDDMSCVFGVSKSKVIADIILLARGHHCSMAGYGVVITSSALLGELRRMEIRDVYRSSPNEQAAARVDVMLRQTSYLSGGAEILAGPMAWTFSSGLRALELRLKQLYHTIKAGWLQIGVATFGYL